MWPSWVFGFSGFQSAPPINSTLPKGESMGPHWLGTPWYNFYFSLDCKGLTACAADPYYTNHVHKIGAKSIQNEAKSRPGAVPETLPKKSSKKLPKVNQKAAKVEQTVPQPKLRQKRV